MVREVLDAPSGTALRRAAWAVLALVVLSVLGRTAAHDVMTQDTTAIIDGVHRTVGCLRDGVVRECLFHPETQSSDVNPYPLLQYLPGFAFAAIGLGDDGIRTALIWGNTLAVGFVVVAAAVRARRIGGSPHAALAVAAIATGMLLPYAGHSFGEPLVVAAVAALCWMVLSDRGWWTSPVAIAVVALLGAVGKETMFVSSALFVAGCLLVGRLPRAEARRRALATGVGLVGGVVVNLAFNVFRFGQLRNVQYFRETRPGIGASIVNTVSLIVAPNGGLLWFWFAAVVAVVALCLAAVRPGSLTRRDQLGVLSTLAGFGIGWVSVGLWWGPFGWYSWGPRLLLPFVVPVIIVALEVFAPGRRSAEPPLRRPALVAALVVLTGALMVPMLADIGNRDAWNTMQEATWIERPECVGVSLSNGESYDLWHSCLMRSAWRTDGMSSVESVTTMPPEQRPWFWLTSAGAVAALALWTVDRHRTVSARSPG